MTMAKEYVIYVFYGGIAMLTFGTTDLQRRTTEVQRAALGGPVLLTYHDKPRFVMMTVEEYVRRPGVALVAGPEAFPDAVVARIQALADEHSEAEGEIAGGLALELDGARGQGGPRP